MGIEMNRTEILSLMQELDSDHFLQTRLVEELVSLTKAPATSSLVVRGEAPTSLSVFPKSDKSASREVIDGKLVVTRPQTTEPVKKKDSSTLFFTGNPVVKPLAEGENQCKWETYGYRCRKAAEVDFCEEHLGETCRYKDEDGVMCGIQANHGCPTELQFVCGTPCCASHSNCGSHRTRPVFY